MAKKGSVVKFSSVISLLIVLAVLFASCGSANSMKSEMYYDNSGSQIEYDMPSEAEKSDDYYSKLEISGGEAVDAELSENGENPLEGRKIIKTVNVVSETKELDSVLARIESEVSALGGYIQSSNVYGKSYEKYSDRHANYTLRIPAEKLDGFMNSMSGLVNITSKTEKVDDITDSYADAEARLTTLKTEETRLLELLAKAEKLEDIITLEERISNVRYEIESYEARIRNYDTLIAFSTVNIELSEVIDYTPEPIKNPTFGERIGKAFSDSWKEFADNCKSFAVGFVYALPTLLVLAVIFGGVAAVVVAIVKGSRKRKDARNDYNDKG